MGLSGGLGAGKSTVGRLLAARGATVIDTDEVARQVLAPGSAGERAVLERFGPPVTAESGSLDRRALAGLVFSVASDRLALEAITHPLIRKEVEARLAAAEEAEGVPIVVIEIPLLDGPRRHEYSLDAVVLVEAPRDVAIERAASRGIPEDQAAARMAAQPSPAERRSASDLVINNTGDMQDLTWQIDRELWPWLLQRLATRTGAP